MAIPQITVEIRWFCQGKIPEKGVKDWFQNNSRFGDILEAKHGKKREDLYLITPGNTHIGPKLSEGRFEIKILQNHPEIIAIEGSAIGKGEIWQKWTWPYAKTGKDKKIIAWLFTSFLARTPENLRVAVWKNRWQRNFKPTSEGELAPVPMSQKGLSCWIYTELTELKVKGAPWWSLTVEIYGDPDNPMAFLQQSLQWILQDYAGPPLELDNSYSYPEWLASL